MYRSATVNRCPRCGTALIELGVGQGIALGCEACGGVWLDEAAFEHVRTRTFRSIAERSSRAPAARTEDPVLACVECHKPLTRVQLSSASVDCCLGHGIWFDPGELEQVSRALLFAEETQTPNARAMLAAAQALASTPLRRSIENLERLILLELARDR